MEKFAPNGCNGNCCERFILPHSYDYMQKSYAACMEARKNPKEKPSARFLKDIEVIGPMLIPLEDGKPVDWDPPTGKKLEHNELRYHYTCKHFDKK